MEPCFTYPVAKLGEEASFLTALSIARANYDFKINDKYMVAQQITQPVTQSSTPAARYLWLADMSLLLVAII